MTAHETVSAGPMWATSRLRLVALDAGLARLQLDDRREFFRALNVSPEATWPPELNNTESMTQIRDRLTENPGQTGWHGWVFIMRWADDAPGRLVGNGGFYGPPDSEGVVEIGYSMLPSFREQGLATEAVEGLSGWAFSQPGVSRIRAHTRVSATASRRVLEKSGFVLAGEVNAPEAGQLAVYTLQRPAG
ncbi:GCN5-like N-acetyltransferase [Glycocaulis alkaliphilus]|uniref:GCN5-like N-acetyltransferase n=1 Tax=Glycocaulis alkaliphilus TaxID=1434191 RepID=A0A3T0EDC8_9PROT|nr:GNAT family N-acetyltransferase [Glycocaulis alkaliphilus]AZU05312.1 GCN5-like N-acetyltransferase [Glycocaulis alkaliphilus]